MWQHHHKCYSYRDQRSICALAFLFLQHTHVLYERQVSSRYGDQISESILQICDAKYKDSGEYVCVAKSGLTTIRAPPTILTVVPGMFFFMFHIHLYSSLVYKV